MDTPIETESRSGAHFRRGEAGESPVFVPADSEQPPRPARAADRGSEAGADGEDALADFEAARDQGRRLYRSGRFRALADFAEDLTGDAWERGDVRVRALARVVAGRAALETGRVRFARMRFESLVDLPLGDREAVHDLLRAARTGLGRIALAVDEPRAAREYFLEALSVPPPAGDDPTPRTSVEARRGLAAAYAALDCPDTAATVYRRALRDSRSAGAHLETALTIAALARLEVRRAEAASDPTLVRVARSAADLAASPLARIEAIRARATARAADPDHDPAAAEQALDDLRDALAIALQTGSVLRQARIERDIAAVLDGLGRDDRAATRRKRARDLLLRDDRGL